MLTQKQLEAIYRECRRVYSMEAVGLVIGPTGSNKQDRILSCENALDELHKRDPENFPRSARSGFAISPKRLLKIDAECRAKGWRIKLIYHSHPGGGVAFSDADRKAALAHDGSPLHPHVEYMVVAVDADAVSGHAFYAWDEARRDFVAR